jgi:Uma2 family endonuclease
MMDAESVRFRWVRPVSDDELLELSELNAPLDVSRAADGELIVTPPSGTKSSWRCSELVFALNLWNRREGRGVVTESSGGYRLPDSSIFAPDAAWVQREKWNAFTPDQQEKYLPVVPDAVFEIMSRTDRSRASREKIDAFRKNGVPIVVLIDPYERRVEVNGDHRGWERAELHFPGCTIPFVLDPQTLD